MVTIADVAARAGVGIGTVSRVLNGSPKVSDATRARVLAAIEVLDYRPSPLARGLSRGRCQTLGVIVPFFTHASAVERLRGVVAALDESRYDLVLFNVESPVHRDEHLASLDRPRPRRRLLVMSLPPRPADLERLHRAGVPVVLVDARGDGVPMVVTDDVEGGRIATRHLVELGHRSIAFIGDDPRQRLRLHLERAAGAGLPRGDATTPGSSRPGCAPRRPRTDVAQRLTAELLASTDPPTAVFASSDVQATGCLAAARCRAASGCPRTSRSSASTTSSSPPTSGSRPSASRSSTAATSAAGCSSVALPGRTAAT